MSLPFFVPDHMEVIHALGEGNWVHVTCRECGHMSLPMADELLIETELTHLCKAVWDR